MIPNEKAILALIKKTQKKVEEDSKKRKPTQKQIVEELDNSNEIFDEMKKKPYTAWQKRSDQLYLYKLALTIVINN